MLCRALGGRRKPTHAELVRGVGFLREFVKVLPDLKAVVALGRDAQAGCRMTNLSAIEICHLSPLGLFGGGANRWDEARAGLICAARLCAEA